MSDPVDPPKWARDNAGKLSAAWGAKDQANVQAGQGSEMVKSDQPKPRPRPPTLGQSADHQKHLDALAREQARAVLQNCKSEAKSAKMGKDKDFEREQ